MSDERIDGRGRHKWNISWPGVGGVISVQFTDDAGVDWTVLIDRREARHLAVELNRAADGAG